MVGMKQRSTCARVSITLLFVCLQLCWAQPTASLASSAANAPAASSTAFECGKPGSLCGADIPAGITCPKGPGWCQPGYYCGKEGSSVGGVSQCRLVPKDCGKAGKPCCPSNANTPHTSSTEKESRKPFCTDGSYCYYSIEPLTMINDVYTGVTSECRCWCCCMRRQQQQLCQCNSSCASATAVAPVQLQHYCCYQL